MDTYTYEEIDLETPGIRLLRLLSGTDDDVISCELFQAYLDDYCLIPYEALSYTWGNTEKAEIVKMDGKELGVTQNLHAALKQLRLEDMDRILWVDAVCIHQGNHQERNHQIKQMGKIYSQADEVIFWLGSATSDTDILMNSLKQFETRTSLKACNSWSLRDDHWVAEWASLQRVLLYQSSDLKIRQGDGLQSLLNRPWFKRIWILQEVANAKRARIYCGAKSVSARIFSLAPWLMAIPPSWHCQAVLDIMPGQSRKYSWWDQKRDLYTLVHKFQDSEASDPRDMIYALLGISWDIHEKGGLYADYTKTNEQVVSDTMFFLFRINGLSASSIGDFLGKFDAFNLQSLCVRVRQQSAEELHQFLKQREYDTQFPQEVLDAAVKNEENGEEVMKQILLPHWSYKLQITNTTLQAIMENTKSGQGIMKLLLGKKRNEIVHQLLFCEEGALRSFLEQHKDLSIGEELLVDAIGRGVGENRVEIILQHLGNEHRGRTNLGQEMIEEAIRQEGPNPAVIELLLRYWAGNIRSTEDILITASRNNSRAPQIMSLLLSWWGDQIKMTRSVIEAAAENKNHGEEMIDLFLRQYQNDINLRTWVLEVSLGGPFREDVLGPLLKQPAIEIEITGEMAEAFTLPRGQKSHFIRLWLKDLFHQQGHLLRVTEDAVKVTALFAHISDILSIILEKFIEIKDKPGVLAKAASNPWCGVEAVNCLLTFWEDEELVTEGVLEAAAANSNRASQIIEVLLQGRRHDRVLTDTVLKAAVENELDGLAATLFILEHRGDGTKISEDILQAAAGNQKLGRDVMELLLEHHSNGVNITEKVLETAIGNQKQRFGIMMLLISRGSRGTEDQIEITDGLMKNTSQMEPGARRDLLSLIYHLKKGNPSNFSRRFM